MNQVRYNAYNSQFNKKTREKNKTLKIVIGSVVGVLLVFALSLLGILIYIRASYEMFPVSGQSMANTLNPNGKDEDYVYVEKTTDVDYYDIIIYNKDTSSNSSMVIKRLIAKGGDWIGFRNSGRMLDSFNCEFEMVIKYGGQGDWQRVDEKYISDLSTYYDSYSDFIKTSANQDLKYDQETEQSFLITYIEVPQDYIFYIGDNRHELGSYDCLDYGPMNKDNIYGKVKYIINENSNKLLQLLRQFFGDIEWK